jgi:hypothetical protein
MSHNLRLGITVEFPDKLVPGDSITILGTAREEGIPDTPQTGESVTYSQWGDIGGLIINQSDLWAALEGKEPTLGGATGTFTSADGKTVEVSNGIVTDIA